MSCAACPDMKTCGDHAQQVLRLIPDSLKVAQDPQPERRSLAVVDSAQRLSPAPSWSVRFLASRKGACEKPDSIFIALDQCCRTAVSGRTEWTGDAYSNRSSNVAASKRSSRNSHGFLPTSSSLGTRRRRASPRGLVIGGIGLGSILIFFGVVSEVMP